MLKFPLIVFMMVTFVGALVHADLKCGGTEPFWDLTIGAKKAKYWDQDEIGKKTTLDILSVQDARGMMPGEVRKYRFKNAWSIADAVVLRKKCDDGMSDTIYPYSITFTTESKVFSGCCR